LSAHDVLLGGTGLSPEINIEVFFLRFAKLDGQRHDARERHDETDQDHAGCRVHNDPLLQFLGEALVGHVSMTFVSRAPERGEKEKASQGPR